MTLTRLHETRALCVLRNFVETLILETADTIGCAPAACLPCEWQTNCLAAVKYQKYLEMLCVCWVFG